MKNLLNKFFTARPAIRKTDFANEVGLHVSMINMIANGERNAGKETERKLKAGMKKYGFDPNKSLGIIE